MLVDGPTFSIPFPHQTERTVATLLRGYRFGPIRDGWIIMFENNGTLPGEQHIDQLCVVMPPAGPLKVRIVKRGRRPGTWDLLTFTGEPELDQPLLWAERVTMLLPYTPTPRDIEALGSGYWQYPMPTPQLSSAGP